MKRLLASLAVLMLSTGCAQRGAPFSNPFIGSDVVPPPGTRGLAPGQAEPYYGPPNQHSPPVIVEPTSQVRPPTSPRGSDPIAFDTPRLASAAGRAPDGVGVSGSESPIRVPADQRRVRLEPAGKVTAAANTTSEPSRRGAEPITVRQIQNELAATTSSPPENYGPWREPVVAASNVAAATQPYYRSETPRYTNPVGCYACEPGVATVRGPQTVEITELPPPGSRVRRRAAGGGPPTQSASRSTPADSFVAAGTQTYRNDEQVRLAGGVTADSGGSAQLLRTVGDSTPRTWARYGYDDSYGWLQGRLEYLRATGQWKLRYIPVDGVTDQFGGSVVLDDAEDLAGLRPGDFVRVQGRIVSSQAAEEPLSPPYRVASLQPLSE